MSLSKKQKDFLKTIENPKDKKYQKQQFKLQNKFDKFGLGEEIIFIDGIFKTDNPELIAFFKECPMAGKSEENSLTKESLRDLTEPKTEIDRTKTHSLLELSFLTDLSIKEVNKCLIMAMQLDTKPWDMSASILMSKFLLIKKSLEDKETKEILSKTDNQNIPKEFCVEITEENKEVLQKISCIPKLDRGFYLRSNSDGNSYEQVHTNLMRNPSDYEFYREVSTEEFLRYIGEDNLIRLGIVPLISDRLFDLGYQKVKKVSAKTDEPKPLDFDLPKKENPIQNIECLSINDIIDSGVLIVESPLCQKLKKHLIGLVEKKTNPLGLK